MVNLTVSNLDRDHIKIVWIWGKKKPDCGAHLKKVAGPLEGMRCSFK